jgi:hypothetical protein
MDEVRNKEGARINVPPFANNTTGGGLSQRYDYIPLDFIKTEVIGLDKNHFTDNPKLLFTTQLKEKDLIRFDWCEVDNMKLKIYPSGRIVLSGSLHKYFNNGEHNYNDFDFAAFRDVLTRLYNDFKLLPHNLWIMQLEYGFNLTPDVKTDTILNGLLFHVNTSFDRIINSRRTSYQAQHEQYILKVYNKGKHHRLGKECLRIEIKQTNWSRYRLKHGIYTLKDFIETDKTLFVNTLVEYWDKVIFYDLTNRNCNKWDKYSNELFWREMRVKRSTKTFSKHANQLRELNRKHGNNTQLKVTELIYSKLDELQGVTFSDITTNERFCKVTGLDISMQRNDSFLLSHTGLFNLYDTNKAEFERMKRRFLTYRWMSKSVKEQVKEIAHNIRSTFNYRQKNSDVNQLSLFRAKGNVLQHRLHS